MSDGERQERGGSGAQDEPDVEGHSRRSHATDQPDDPATEHEHDEHEVRGHHHLPTADLVAGTYDQDRQRRAAKDRQVKEARDADQPSGGGPLGRLRNRNTT